MTTAYPIEPLQGGQRVIRPPTPGRWYAGITAGREVGAVARFERGMFLNSDKPDEPGVDMGRFEYLRETPQRV